MANSKGWRPYNKKRLQVMLEFYGSVAKLSAAAGYSRQAAGAWLAGNNVNGTSRRRLDAIWRELPKDVRDRAKPKPPPRQAPKVKPEEVAKRKAAFAEEVRTRLAELEAGQKRIEDLLGKLGTGTGLGMEHLGAMFEAFAAELGVELPSPPTRSSA